MVNQSLVTDSTIWQPGFNLPDETWCVSNRFRKVSVLQTYTSGAWRPLTSADVGWSRQCHISKLHGGGLQRLHSVDDVAANWLEGMVVKDKWQIVNQSESVVENGSRTLTSSGSVAEWLACWTQAQKGLGSNRSRDAVG